MKMKMTSDRIKVKIMRDDDTSEGGIYLGNINPLTGTRHNYYRGIVMEVGEGRINNNGVHFPMNVKVGDDIMYPTNPYKDFNDDDGGYKYHILHEADVMGVFDSKEETKKGEQ